MLTLFIKRLIVFGMAFISLFTTYSGSKYTDNFRDYDFPIIAAEKQKVGTLRVMSFNIRTTDVNGTEVKDRISIGVRQVLDVMPDSIGLQEVTKTWMIALDKLLIMYDWVGMDRESGGSPLKGGESCPIFYLKTKYRLLDSGSFWLSETPNEPSFGPGAACRRVCTWAKLKNRLTGETYIHVNTHFDHISEEARVAGAEIVMNFIEESCAGFPVVFTADMNTNEEGEAYAIMTRNLADTRLEAKCSAAYGTFHGGKDPSEKSDYYIDFVLCSDDFDVCEYRTVTKGVDKRFTSDHFPIYADLRFKCVK